MCVYNDKPLKSVFTSCTEISDLIKNYAHHGKKQTHQWVEDGYIFVKPLQCLHAIEE